MRAVYRIADWVSQSANASFVGEILSRPEYHDVSAGLIKSNLRGENTIKQNGHVIHDPLSFRLDVTHI